MNLQDPDHGRRGGRLFLQEQQEGIEPSKGKEMLRGAGYLVLEELQDELQDVGAVAGALGLL